MDPIRINDMVDRKIISSFQEGFSIGAIQSDLTIRMNNFKKILEKDGIDANELLFIKYEDIPQIRHRYGITYMKQCEKRINDLTWILSNKYKFKHLENSKIFSLLKFKEKLELNAHIVDF